jgi:hypothetical protein
MTAPTQVDVAATVAVYQSTSLQLRENLAAFITRLWNSLGTYGNGKIPEFTRQLIPVVAGSQQQMAAMTSAYLANQRAAALGAPLRVTGVSPRLVTGAAVRNGTAPADVYERPFHTVWRELGAAKDGTAGPMPQEAIDAAIEAGLKAAVSSAMTDLQLTKTRTSRLIVSQDKRAICYRRILEGAYSCGLCVVASTNRYGKSELMPIHPGCDCSVMPMYDTGEDRLFGEAADATLASAHDAVAATFGASSPAASVIPGSRGAKYRDVLITHQHGELGPVLAVRGQKFTGPGSL